MRVTFFNELLKLAHEDPDCYLLVGDVGYSVVEAFAQAFPDRYINTGIAEQNMIGVAAGLAMAGKRVYVYSITPFACMRPFEQIRNDLCYQQLPVTVVANGSGFSYGQAGATHHALEDIALMRALPGMTVIAPGSAHELASLMPEIHHHKNPVYLRLGPAETCLPYPQGSFTLGSSIELLSSEHAVLIASGSALARAGQICQSLRSCGYDIGVISMPTIKPLTLSFLSQKPLLRAIITIEEHSLIGGLGEAIGYQLARLHKKNIRFAAFGLKDVYPHEAGSRMFLTEQAGLESNYLIQEIKKILAPVPEIHTLNNQEIYHEKRV